MNIDLAVLNPNIDDKLFDFLTASVKDQAIFGTDSDGCILTWNSGAKHMSGYAEEEIIGQNVSILYSLTDDEQILKLQDDLKQALAYGKHITEAWLTRKGGSQFLACITYKALYHDNNELIGLAVLIQEIVSQYKLPEDIITVSDSLKADAEEHEKNQVSADLIQRNTDLEQFIYIVSHNLKAPVANIAGLCDLLCNLENQDKENDDLLRALSASVRNLSDVIAGLSDIIQVSSVASDASENVSLPTLVDEVQKSIEHLVINNHVTIHYDFTEVQVLKSLKAYLYSIFHNLILNGIKYRRPDVNTAITVVSKLRDGKAYIYIRDNGKGIDLGRHGSELFGLYKRFDKSVEGKGVGLFMVKMQVERLGGKIVVRSEINKGTEFEIELPVH